MACSQSILLTNHTSEPGRHRTWGEWGGSTLTQLPSDHILTCQEKAPESHSGPACCWSCDSHICNAQTLAFYLQGTIPCVTISLALCGATGTHKMWHETKLEIFFGKARHGHCEGPHPTDKQKIKPQRWLHYFKKGPLSCRVIHEESFKITSQINTAAAVLTDGRSTTASVQ